MKKIFLGLAFIAACSNPETNVRFIHAIPDAPEITISVENSTFVEKLAYGQATELKNIKASTRIISIKQSSDNQSLITFQTEFKENEPATLGLIGNVSKIEAVRLEEKEATPLPGKARVRVWTLAPNLPSADVYFTNPTDEDLTSKTPNFKGLAQKVQTTFVDLEPASYRIRLTSADSKNAISDTGSIALEANQVVLFLALDKAGGGIPVSLIRFNQ